MRNYSVQLWLGAWLLIVPFLGVPGDWKERLTMLTGLFLLLAVLWAHYRKDD